MTVEGYQAGLRLDVFLAQYIEQLPSRTAGRHLIDRGFVLLNGQGVNAHHRVGEGDIIEVHLENIEPDEINVEPENIPLDVLYEDPHIIVINKAVGMLVHPVHGFGTGTLVNALLYHCTSLSNVNEEHRPGIVHRLDRETSGVILVAKSDQAHVRLAKQFEQHKVQKRYVAIVKGLIEFDEGVVDVPLGKHPLHFDKRAVSFDETGSREAETSYRVIRRCANGTTVVALFPKTGRTHQLRVHMKHLGHPILGDDKYGDKNSFSRLALHAQSIIFQHPVHKWPMEVVAPLPQEILRYP